MNSFYFLYEKYDIINENQRKSLDENEEKIATKNKHPNAPPPTPRQATRPKW